MSIKLATLNANDSLANLETAINQTEQLGFELITFAKGMVTSQPADLATFRRLAPGTPPAKPLTLVQESVTNQLAQQQADLNAGETGSKQLISYSVVYVQGAEANVAAYRG
jgi:capsule polysaccharide export protein KpsE/RkpR